ncbi:fimbrial protein [Morganella morganii]|uniref:fimbrial protein n=1 Tax=Morganella morganii TaxID=582 RepID=UPI0021CF3771|nr:fimbrial protein [Morganella morganii]MCU6213122.1 fimbrial protein [Morganella morganii]
MGNRQPYDHDKKLNIPATNRIDLEEQIYRDTTEADLSHQKLRILVKILNCRFRGHRFMKHQNKTFIDNIQCCFDSLGAWFTDQRVMDVAPQAVKNYHEKVQRFYKLTKHRPKEKQAKRVSDYRKLWKCLFDSCCLAKLMSESERSTRTKLKILYAVLCVLSFSPHSIHAAEVVYPSVITPGTAVALPFSVQSSYTVIGGGSYGVKCTTGVKVVVGSQPLNGFTANDCVQTSQLAWSSDGKYYGYRVQTGVILAIVSATASGDVKLRASGVTYPWQPTNIRWDSSGISTGTWSLESGTAWNAGMWRNDASFTTSNNDIWSATAAGTVVLSVDASVPTGTVINLPILYLSAPLRGTPIALQAAVEVVQPLTCSVYSPSTIDFGTINRNVVTGTLLATQKGDLTLNCNGSAKTPKSNMNVSFTGNTAYSGKLLQLRNSSDEITLANIRGRLASPLSGTCSSYSANDVIFDGTVSLTKSNVGVGQTVIPLTWSLCQNSTVTNTGEGSAQATVTIDWE